MQLVLSQTDWIYSIMFGKVEIFASCVLSDKVSILHDIWRKIFLNYYYRYLSRVMSCDLHLCS